MAVEGAKFSVLLEAHAESAKKEINEFFKVLKNISVEVGKGNVGAGHGLPAHKGMGGGFEDVARAISGLRGGLSGLTGSLSGALGAAAGPVLAVTEGIELVQQSLAQIQGMGMMAMGLGMKGLGMFGSFMVDVGKAGGQMEASILRIKMFGKMSEAAAMNIVKGVQDIVAYTPFMEDQVLDLTTALVQSGVSLDAYKDKAGNIQTLNKSMAQGFSQVSKDTLIMAGNMQQTATSAVLDFAAATGNVGWKMTTFVRGFQRLLSSGQATMLRDQLPMQLVDRLGKAGKKGATAVITEINKIIKEKAWVGFSAEASSTMEGIISNFKEVPLRIFKAIADVGDKEGPYARIKRGLLMAFNIVNETLSDPKFLGALKGSMLPAVDAVVWSMQALAKAFKAVVVFIKDYPGVAKWAVTLSLLGSVLLVVGGALVAGVAALAGFAVAAVVATIAVLGLTSLLSPLAITLIPLLALGAVLLGASGIAVYAGWEGIVELFTSIKTVISAVSEAWSNWGAEGTSVSLETGDALKKAGLWETFENIVGWMMYAQTAWEGFRDRLLAGVAPLEGRWGAAWDRMGKALQRVWDTVYNLLEAVGILAPSSETTVGEARTSFESLADVFVAVANAATWTFEVVAAVVDAAIPYVGTAVTITSELYFWFIVLKNVIEGAFTLLYTAAYVALTPLRMMYNLLVGIGKVLVGIGTGNFESITEGLAQAGKALTTDAIFSNIDQIGKAYKSITEDVRDVGKAYEQTNKIEALYGDIGQEGGRRIGRGGIDLKGVPREEMIAMQSLAPGATAASMLPDYSKMMSTAPSKESPLPPAPATWESRYAPAPAQTKIETRMTLELDGRVLGEAIKEYVANSSQSSGMPEGTF